MTLTQNQKIDIMKRAYDSVACYESTHHFCERMCKEYGCDWSFDFYAYLESEHRKQRQNFESCNF